MKSTRSSPHWFRLLIAAGMALTATTATAWEGRLAMAYQPDPYGAAHALSPAMPDALAHPYADRNAAFNRLWLQSFHPGRTPQEGPQAAGKLLHLWVLSLLKTHDGSDRALANRLARHPDAAGAYRPRNDQRQGGLDYRLGAIGGQIGLALYYHFD